MGILLIVSGSSSPVAADSDIRSKICAELDAPTITDPATDISTTDDARLVRGAAFVGQVVTVTRNGIGAGAVTAGPGGQFEMLVPLAVGANAIQAQVTNDCDTVRSSGTVTITRTTNQTPTGPQQPEPQQPTTQTPIGGLEPVTGQSRPWPGGQGAEQPRQGVEATQLSKPRITYPTTGLQVTEGQVRVAGTADPGSVVLLFVNGEVVAQVSVTVSGQWAAMVGLTPGSNTVQAQASRDGQTATSEQVQVGYTRKGVSRLIDEPYNVTVQVISLVVVCLGIGMALFVLHRWHRIRAHFVRKKKL